ncbi:MAG: hypothetical protein EOP10_05350 [Proteobacteria bacterium]|nr:MAG: hypothetical protein EOP10_05350 [Pseudomonadota bacterium]
MRLTISAFLGTAIISLLGLVFGLYFQLDLSSQAWVDESALQVRKSAIDRAGNAIEAYLDQSEGVVLSLRDQILAGDCSNSQSCLLFALLANPHLTEITFTQARQIGFDDEGHMQMDPYGRHQISVYREGAGDKVPICTREVSGSAGNFSAETRCRSPQKILSADGSIQRTSSMDPTESDAFKTPAEKGKRDQLLRSDLSWSSLDDLKPLEQRRVVLVYILGVEDKAGNLLGVIKAGIEAKVISDMVRSTKVNALSDKDYDPYLVFIADQDGRLISEVNETERPSVDGDDLRIVAKDLPLEAKEALRHPALAATTSSKPSSGTFKLSDRTYHVSYRLLANTWGWRVGVVGPAAYYLGHLEEQRQHMLLGMALVMALALVCGLVVLRAVQGAFRQIQDQTRAMSGFDFRSRQTHSLFQEVNDTLFSIEVAKTAMRAMGLYVPLPLVQKLFSENREPALGGHLQEISIFFSDIEGFTTRAEEEEPDVVAQWLGQYLAIMTEEVHAQGGTVDKFIGDSVMALWNAPTELDDHAARACRAALRCQDATRELFATESWTGREPLVTRIGLHLGHAMVGHFGAPDRLNFTAIGDAVNLASRLESLNRHYGTRVIVSEDMRIRVQALFNFRRLDVVRVKGKNKLVEIYELLSEKSGIESIDPVIDRYEKGLEHYLAGRFDEAQSLLRLNQQDPPSLALLNRCQNGKLI